MKESNVLKGYVHCIEYTRYNAKYVRGAWIISILFNNNACISCIDKLGMCILHQNIFSHKCCMRSKRKYSSNNTSTCYHENFSPYKLFNSCHLIKYRILGSIFTSMIELLLLNGSRFICLSNRTFINSTIKMKIHAPKKSFSKNTWKCLNQYTSAQCR